MKILHVSESDNIGGAAIAASRLNTLLLSFGIDSKLLVNRKKSGDSNIIAPTTFINLIYAKLLPHFLLRYYKLSLGTTTISLCLNKSTPFFLNALKKESFDIIYSSTYVSVDWAMFDRVFNSASLSNLNIFGNSTVL